MTREKHDDSDYYYLPRGETKAELAFRDACLKSGRRLVTAARATDRWHLLHDVNTKRPPPFEFHSSRLPPSFSPSLSLVHAHVNPWTGRVRVRVRGYRIPSHLTILEGRRYLRYGPSLDFHDIGAEKLWKRRRRRQHEAANKRVRIVSGTS